MIKEGTNKSLIFLSELLIGSFAHKKLVIRSNLKKNKIIFLCMFFKVYFCKFLKNERFAHSLFFKERCERIAQVAHDK